MRGRRWDAGELLAFAVGSPGFFAGLERYIAGAETYGDFPQEGVGRSAHSEDPDKIVRNLLLGSDYVDDD